MLPTSRLPTARRIAGTLLAGIAVLSIALSPLWPGADALVTVFTCGLPVLEPAARDPRDATYTFNASDECFRKENDGTWSDVAWDPLSGRVEMVGQRTDAVDEMLRHDTPEAWTSASASWSVGARFRAAVQGNWQQAYPLFVANAFVTSVGTDAGVVAVQYEARDQMAHQPPAYRLMYRDGNGVARIDVVSTGAPDTEYRFLFQYEAGMRVLSLRMSDAAGVVLASGSYTVGTHPLDGFALHKFGAAVDGRGASLEPWIEAWSDDVSVRATPTP